MSECVGEGCTHPGCSGRNAEVIQLVAGGVYDIRIGGAPEPTTVVPNRRDRRRKKARRG
jgi:hypothetical protein